MHDFDYDSAPAALLTPDITAVLTSIHEYRGKQPFFLAAKDEVLSALVEVAKMMSVESSNRIEGVNAPSFRFKSIVKDDAEPRNEAEFAIRGYLETLCKVLDGYVKMPPDTETILSMHKSLFSSLPQVQGGVWKSEDVAITEIDGEGRESVRFKPVSAAETPLAMELLCREYAKAVQRDVHNPLLLALMFVFDFLCIHPFRDGNGRMSRLLTLLLANRCGYMVGRYISIDRLVDDSRQEYYEALRQSSVGWHESANDMKPYMKFMLGIILKAYRELESRVDGLVREHTSKADRVRIAILSATGSVTKREIAEKCPDVSIGMIEAMLYRMQGEGAIVKTGNGRKAAYTCIM